MDTVLFMKINYYSWGSISYTKLKVQKKHVLPRLGREECNIIPFPKGEEIPLLFYLDSTAKTALISFKVYASEGSSTTTHGHFLFSWLGKIL